MTVAAAPLEESKPAKPTRLQILKQKLQQLQGDYYKLSAEIGQNQYVIWLNREELKERLHRSKKLNARAHELMQAIKKIEGTPEAEAEALPETTSELSPAAQAQSA